MIGVSIDLVLYRKGSVIMGNKIDDLVACLKSRDLKDFEDLMHRKDPCEKKRHVVLCVLAIVGAVAAVAAIAYAVYRYMNPDYLDDFDDDFDDYEDDSEDESADDATSEQ